MTAAAHDDDIARNDTKPSRKPTILDKISLLTYGGGDKIVIRKMHYMKYRLLILMMAPLFFFSYARAELQVTPYGVFDTDSSVKINYNVLTENGVETKTKVVPSKEVLSKERIQTLAKKLNTQKFILSPANTESFEKEKEIFTYVRAEPKATAQMLRVRRYQRVKAQIQQDTRTFYKKEIPEAIAPLGSFINEYGGSMILTNKEKQPIGTLIISFSVESIPLADTEEERQKFFPDSRLPLLKKAEFFLVSEIPSTWKRGHYEYTRWPTQSSSYSYYILPSGENILVVREGKFYRCFGFAEKIEIRYIYEKIK